MVPAMAKGQQTPPARPRPRTFKKPPLQPMVTTLWEYPSQHYGEGEQGSQAYRGATPSWVIWQVLQRFTKAGDVVLDPFCGSGTTLDVCKDTERRGVGFDIAPSRADIRQGDARKLPLEAGSVEVAFLDPPYADNLTYSDDPACIGRLRADDGSWHDAMEQVLAEMSRVVRPGGHMAIYISDIRKRNSFYSLGVDMAAMGQAYFKLLDHVSVVRHNKDLEKGNYRKAAAEGGFMLRGFNHLLLFERPPLERPRQERPRKERPRKERPRSGAPKGGGPRAGGRRRGGT